MNTLQEQDSLFKRVITFLSDISVENICLLAEFGIPKRKCTIFTLRENFFKNFNRPVFFISTGRCGTNWFQSLLSKDKPLKVVHEPKPNLAFQNKFAHKIFNFPVRQQAIAQEFTIETLSEIFTAGREKYLRYCYKTERRFVETNHYQIFFAPAIASLISDVLFIHLYRHPG